LRVSTLALTVSLVASPLAAPAQQPIFRAGVEVIEVDVSVVDDRGHPVADLHGPEFTVTIDGKPRRVVSADFVSFRGGESKPRSPEPETADSSFSSNTSGPRGRLIVIGVDRDSITFGEGRTATRAAEKFLDKLRPSDKVAVVNVPQFGPATGFTSNHKVIQEALMRAVGVAHRPRGTFNIGVYEALSIAHHSDSRTETFVLFRFCGRMRGMAASECESEVRSQASDIAEQIRERVDNSIRALRAILESLREIEGPKSLVWITEGLVIEGPGGELADLGRLAAAANTTVNVILLDAPLADVTEAETSPSTREDRELETRGPELLAGITRGALYRVSANAAFVFERMEDELSAYYLLGVESLPGDKDRKRHSINVSVRRRGTTVRARQEFQGAPDAPRKAESLEDRLRGALGSPLALTELPIRLTTYAYQDSDRSKVRLVVATEIERSADVSPDMNVGMVLSDADGKTVTSSLQRATLSAADGVRGPVLEHLAALVVDPGTYTLKLAAIDAGGRRGSIERPVNAWQMSGVPFAVSDLLIGDVPAKPAEGLRPAVEAHLATGQLGAYMELYSDQPDYFASAQVRVEVAKDSAGPALASALGQLEPAKDARNSDVSALVPVGALPPGEYVARAIVRRGDRKIGELARPFQIVRSAGPAAAVAMSAAVVAMPPAISSMLTAPAAFRRDAVLRPEVIASFMDALDKGRPALKNTTKQVRGGRFDGAARQAFDAGDQLAAAFLRGLELFAKGDFNPAATQFTAALRIDPQFAPASFYLGACYAVGGRDREAMTAWRTALLAAEKTPVQYAALADAGFRLGDEQLAIAPLRDAVSAFPRDDELRRRLAMAYALTAQYNEALATVEPYLTRHPADHEALLVAVHAIYAARVAGQPLVGGDQDRARMATYARAYTAAKGPHEALVAAWAAFVDKR
jgi:VWFA-related protein